MCHRRRGYYAAGYGNPLYFQGRGCHGRRGCHSRRYAQLTAVQRGVEPAVIPEPTYQQEMGYVEPPAYDAKPPADIIPKEFENAAFQEKTVPLSMLGKNPGFVEVCNFKYLLI
jgi:hypothetical protein